MFYNSDMVNKRNKMSCTTSRISENINEIFINKIVQEVKEDSKILDLGTGNGFVLSEINRRLKYNLKLIGIDLSKILIEQNKDININLIQGDNYNLPFDDNTFDIVTAKNVTRFSTDEVYRVLKKGGKFIFREYGEYKGLVEISKLFKKRLIRSRDIGFYLKRLKKSGFLKIYYKTYLIEREYESIEDILNVIQSFPYIKKLNKEDLKNIEEYLKLNKEHLKISSDPFILEAEK